MKQAKRDQPLHGTHLMARQRPIADPSAGGYMSLDPKWGGK